MFIRSRDCSNKKNIMSCAFFLKLLKLKHKKPLSFFMLDKPVKNLPGQHRCDLTTFS